MDNIALVKGKKKNLISCSACRQSILEVNPGQAKALNFPQANQKARSMQIVCFSIILTIGEIIVSR